MKLYCEKCKKVFDAGNAAAGSKTECPECKSVIDVPASPTAPGVVVGDFLIRKAISKGGMGEVLLAQQLSLDRPVALKVIQDKFSGDREYVESLFHEARAAAKISHPNIVQAYAVGEDSGLFYFAMEYVKGETFKQILKREGVLDFKQAAKVICEISRALAAVWNEQRLVHHDIKPDNIMLDAHGIAKLADLGLARRASNEEDTGDEVLGTPQYISPEQLTGVPTDVRSDLYSLGATFYQFVTGRFPYVAATHEEMAKMHVAGNLEPPRSVNPKVPEELNRIILKMMAREPEQRYQMPEPLIADLENYLKSTDRPMPGKLSGLKGFKLPTPGVKPGVPATKLAGIPGRKTTLGVPSAGRAPLPGTPKLPSGRPPQSTPPNKSQAQGAAPTPTSPAVVQQAAPPSAAPKIEPQKLAAASPAAVAKPVAEKTGVGELAGSLAKSTRKEEAPPVAIANRKKKDKTTETQRPAWLKGVLRGILTVAGIAVVAILLGVTVYIIEKKDRMPEFAKPYSSKLRAWADTTFFTADQTNVSPSPANNTARPEFLTKVAGLVSELQIASDRENALRKTEEFVKSAEATPRAGAEIDALKQLLAAYAPADEAERFSTWREQQRKRHLAAISERSSKIEAEKRKADEAALAAEELRKKQMKQAEEFRLLQARREQLISRRRGDLAKAMEPHFRAMLLGFFPAAIDGNPEELNRAIASAAELLIPTACTSLPEKAMIARYQSFQRELPVEAKKLADCIKKFGSITPENSIALDIPRRGLVSVVKIAPGSCEYLRDDVLVPVNIDRLPPQSKIRFFNQLKRRLKIDNVEFYFNLMNRQIIPHAKRIAPPGFWRDNADFIVDLLRKAGYGNKNPRAGSRP